MCSIGNCLFGSNFDSLGLLKNVFHFLSLGGGMRLLWQINRARKRLAIFTGTRLHANSANGLALEPFYDGDRGNEILLAASR